MTDEEGLCIYTRDHREAWLRKPFHLQPVERAAIQIWQDAIDLSPWETLTRKVSEKQFIEVRLPTLLKIDYVLGLWSSAEFTSSELLKRVLAIHRTYRRLKLGDTPPSEETDDEN